MFAFIVIYGEVFEATGELAFPFNHFFDYFALVQVRLPGVFLSRFCG